MYPTIPLPFFSFQESDLLLPTPVKYLQEEDDEEEMHAGIEGETVSED